MKIAFFGTGLLGEPMAHQLVDAGYDVTVYNRTVSKSEALKNKGAAVAQTPLEAMKKADVFITMLADYPAVDAVLFSIPSPPFKGKTLIQMSTISPQESLLLKKRVEEAGGEYLEAPVLGSIPQAKSRTLFVLFGGTQEQYDKWQDLLKTFGDKLIMFNAVGRASAAKLALNQLIASLTTAFSMSLGYLREKQVDIDKFMGILRDSALYATTFDKKFARMMQRDFSNPNFPVKHLLKDVDLMLRDFGDAGINIAALEGVKKIILKTMENGDADMDYSALYNAVHPSARGAAEGPSGHIEGFLT
ncbi:MAG: NAD-binding protein [Candidatus Aminicenantes bacterium]|nr:NAD-binding protein [Candidatus Aminicenantes bacterium]NIM85084.1 NAD-binding protein [Candidatus Aminicenantes bacterium]NIN24591.1 NAD-binding protein [Candidatus Aminicenantes bacterium]NIN48355.1 NAD-binding protein [Candidatus Aminicenantes bacterium]NIN91258.1 NAD-binding protein [Candidatus Aminicenantes bacterium]